ncbi:hypothetical protein CBR_g50937 [Chara braunii]|uniref:Uncharacterized protein n=1 Tax=Chara braunii TaxID=69332 RepID=A0A388M7X9_CHABU|nr:hypothetical protein CBR_g50937 [Chara braunii]|eukprot:GBG90593.1 hypothetical protein CBR_g50937 [Chara braunii]
MAMLVYKNGAFVREDIRDKCAGCSWESFSQKLDQTPPLNDGCLGFYYKDPEITPAVSDSASLGAALRAAHGWLCKEQEVLPFVSAAEEEADGKAPEQGANNFLPFSVLIKHAAPDSAIGLQLAATAGGQEMHESYGRLMRVRQSLEAKIICEAGRRA